MLARKSARAAAVAARAGARAGGAGSVLLRSASTKGSSSRVGRQAIFNGLPVTFADISEARYRIRPGELPFRLLAAGLAQVAFGALRRQPPQHLAIVAPPARAA